MDETINALTEDFAQYGISMPVIIKQAKGEVGLEAAHGVIALGKEVGPENAWEVFQFLRGYYTPEGQKPPEVKGLKEHMPEAAAAMAAVDPRQFMDLARADISALKDDLATQMSDAGIDKADIAEILADKPVAKIPAVVDAPQEPAVDVGQQMAELQDLLQGELKDAGLSEAEIADVMDDFAPKPPTEAPVANTGSTEIPDIKEIQDMLADLIEQAKNTPGFSEGSAAVGGI